MSSKSRRKLPSLQSSSNQWKEETILNYVNVCVIAPGTSLFVRVTFQKDNLVLNASSYQLKQDEVDLKYL